MSRLNQSLIVAWFSCAMGAIVGIEVSRIDIGVGVISGFIYALTVGLGGISLILTGQLNKPRKAKGGGS